jgi:hypothetical protein
MEAILIAARSDFSPPIKKFYLPGIRQPALPSKSPLCYPENMNTSTQTRLAMLGTIADLHLQPLAYDLACLRMMIIEVSPDLLCAEVTQVTWESGNLPSSMIELRKALSPVEASTDIVLVPVAFSEMPYEEFFPQTGWRKQTARSLRRFLRWGQRKAGTPEAINGFWFSAFCHLLCNLNEAIWSGQDRALWDQQNRGIVENILRVIRQDPGRRVLVVVQCQRLHRLIRLLKAFQNELVLVSYQEL